MFGIMAVLLGSGDAFHLVPRAVALCTTGLENFTVQMGLGKWITSITMTIFYVVLYHICIPSGSPCSSALYNWICNKLLQIFYILLFYRSTYF